MQYILTEEEYKKLTGDIAKTIMDVVSVLNVAVHNGTKMERGIRLLFNDNSTLDINSDLLEIINKHNK